VYLWDASSGSTSELTRTADGDYVTAISWSADGAFLAVGTDSASVQIWDVNQSKKLRTLRGHSARIGCIAWNGHVLSTGSQDTTIMNHDVRIKQHLLGTMRAHSQEVCGLRWSTNGEQLASGGNDNVINVFDRSCLMTSADSGNPLHTFTEHTGAVKALAWAPFQSNLLASGGGSTDRCIKVWNTRSGSLLDSTDTGSQVCSLQWSTHSQELCSSHGHTQNQLSIWKYPSMVKLVDLTAHSARVLHTAMSPDGHCVASLAADATLRIWRAFEPVRQKTAPLVSKTTSGSAVCNTLQPKQLR